MRDVRSPAATRLPGRLVAGLWLGALAFAMLIGPLGERAGAHATLLETSPGEGKLLEEAPEVVELTFTEPVELLADSIRVVAPDQVDVQQGSPEASPDGTVASVPVDTGASESPQGTYVVTWHVVSTDGHNIEGSFLFSIGGRSQAAELGEDQDRSVVISGFVGRWLAFMGTVTAVGAAALALSSPTERGVSARLSRLVFAGGIVGAIGVGVALVSQVAETVQKGWANSFGDVPDALGSRAVDYMALRLLALVVVAVLGGVLWRQRPALLLAVVFGGVSLAMSSLLSHAWSSEQRELAVVSDVVHFSAVSVWVGGLLALLVALPVARDAPRLARRFSAMALGAVFAVVPTGTILGWQHVGSLDNLPSTTYGRMLLAKLALFGVLLVFGWLNKTQLVAMVERSVAPLRNSLRGEAMVAVVVLGLTAALVHQPPGRSESPGGGGAPGEMASGVIPNGKHDGVSFSQLVNVDSVPAEDGSEPVPAGPRSEMHLDVVPATVGPNTIYLHFFGEYGAPLAVAGVRVEMASSVMSAPLELNLSQLSPSHASASDVTFPTAGTWTVQVFTSVLESGETITFTFEVLII